MNTNIYIYIYIYMDIIFRTTAYRFFLDSDAPGRRRTAQTNDLGLQGPGVVLAISPCKSFLLAEKKTTLPIICSSYSLFTFVL